MVGDAEYARSVLEISGSPDVAAQLAGRMRRQTVLHEPGRRFECAGPRLVRVHAADPPRTDHRSTQRWS